MNFVHEDGKGKLFDDEGNEVSVVEMEVDQVNHLGTLQILICTWI